MILDIHTHILPCMDDGSKSTEMSVEMLQKEVRDGTELVICTPHYYAERENVESFLARKQKAEEKLTAAVRENSNGQKFPALMSGAEVAFYRGISENRNIRKLCIRHTNLLLLELPFDNWTDAVPDEIEEIRRRYGVRIILAHLERFYMMFKKNRDMIDEMLESSLYVQVNAEGMSDKKTRKVLTEWMRDDLIDFLGSDCHRSDKRKPNLAEGRAEIEKIMGRDYLNALDERSYRIFSENIIERKKQ